MSPHLNDAGHQFFVLRSLQGSDPESVRLVRSFLRRNGPGLVVPRSHLQLLVRLREARMVSVERPGVGVVAVGAAFPRIDEAGEPVHDHIEIGCVRVTSGGWFETNMMAIVVRVLSAHTHLAFANDERKSLFALVDSTDHRSSLRLEELGFHRSSIVPRDLRDDIDAQCDEGGWDFMPDVFLLPDEAVYRHAAWLCKSQGANLGLSLSRTSRSEPGATEHVRVVFEHCLFKEPYISGLRELAAKADAMTSEGSLRGTA